MTVKMDTKGLDGLLKLLKTSKEKARVGIMGSGAAEMHMNADGSSSGATNVTIGAAHEFGIDIIQSRGDKTVTISLPERSFLRIPLQDLWYSRIKAAGGFGKSVLTEIIKTKSFTPWLTKAGLVGVEIVQGAFDSGGYGKWKVSNMRYKKNHQTLVETQQLRNSVISEVVAK